VFPTLQYMLYVTHLLDNPLEVGALSASIEFTLSGLNFLINSIGFDQYQCYTLFQNFGNTILLL